MLDRVNTLLLSGMISLMLAADALGQTPRPPSGPQQFSIEKAVNWLITRPGVMIAVAIAIAAIAYGIYANRRRKA